MDKVRAISHETQNSTDPYHSETHTFASYIINKKISRQRLLINGQVQKYETMGLLKCALNG